MADPVLHIKDAYFFEVPKALWRADYESLDDVPEFLTKAHPHATVEEFEHAMDGKILIPQPFGTLKNLHEAASGFCISKFMVLELVVAAIIFLLFTRLAKVVKADAPPQGRFANMLETFLVFIKENIAHSAIGHGYEKFVPLLWTIFFFILGCNLMGLIPWLGAPTGAWGATFALALVILGTGLYMGAQALGPVGFWMNMVPKMDLPLVLKPLQYLIQVFIFLVEVLGMLIKHTVLSIRLLANMVAGHLVILAILGMVTAAANAPAGQYATVATIGIAGTTLFNVLELGVAFLQAYIFTFLSALFLGMATHHH